MLFVIRFGLVLVQLTGSDLLIFLPLNYALNLSQIVPAVIYVFSSLLHILYIYAILKESAVSHEQVLNFCLLPNSYQQLYSNFEEPDISASSCLRFCFSAKHDLFTGLRDKSGLPLCSCVFQMRIYCISYLIFQLSCSLLAWPYLLSSVFCLLNIRLVLPSPHNISLC